MNSLLRSPTFHHTKNLFSVLLVVAATLAAMCTLWVSVRAVLAYQHLSRIESTAASALSDLGSSSSATVATLASLADEARSAHELTSDPIWTLAQGLPWIGPQLSAASTLAASSNELISQGILPLASALSQSAADDLTTVDGHIDLEILENLAGPATSAAAHSSAAANDVSSIDRKPLVGIIGSAVQRTDEAFARSAGAIDALSRATRVLPTLLRGKHDYLAIVQNNAEWRSLGGITGTAILLHASDGEISLSGFESATSLSQDITTPVVDLPDELVDIYDTKPARYFHNLTQIPDFTIDAPIAREMYRARTGKQVDGVLAIDPIVLSYLLNAEKLLLPGGETLTAENAAEFLMNDVYWRYPEPSDQDAVFAAATAAAFDGILRGQVSAFDLLAAFGRATDERRLLFWSADPDIQSILAGTRVSGGLPQTDGRTARIGVYLNDGTGSKMSYYTEPSISLTWNRCTNGAGSASRELTLDLTLTNRAPLDAYVSLPPYITGEGAHGTAPGSSTVVTNLYIPGGYEIISTQTSDKGSVARKKYLDRQVLTFGLTVEPQSSAGATVVIRAPSTVIEAEAFVTPTADPDLSPTILASCTGAPTGTLE